MFRSLSIGPLARNLFATAGVQVTVALLALVSGPLQARGLGPDGRGQLAVVLIIGQFAAFLSDGGILGYIIRERAAGRERGELVGSALPILAGSFLAWALAAWPLALLFGKGDHTLSILIATQLAFLPFAACIQLGSAIALGEERWRTMVTIRLTAAIVPFVGLLALFVTGHLTIVTACICYFAATVISSLPALRLCWVSRPVLNKSLTAAAWRFGRISMVNTFVTTSNARADVLIISLFLSLSDAGYYAVAATLAGIPLMLVNAINQSLSRRLSRNDLGAETAHASRLLMLGIVALCIAIAGAAPFVVPWLFGADFSASVPVVLVLLLGTLCAVQSTFLGYATNLVNQPKHAAFAQIVGLLVMVVAMVILAHVCGLIGAALGSALGYAAAAVILVRNASRTSGLPWHSYLIPRKSDLGEVLTALRHK